MILKSKELINALLDGAILERTHNENDFLFGGIEYLYAFIQNDKVCFESKGFTLPTKNTEERVIDVLKNPNDWKISCHSMSNGFPYPWDKNQ